jgi:hypothetical protein
VCVCVCVCVYFKRVTNDGYMRLCNFLVVSVESHELPERWWRFWGSGFHSWISRIRNLSITHTAAIFRSHGIKICVSTLIFHGKLWKLGAWLGVRNLAGKRHRGKPTRLCGIDSCIIKDVCDNNPYTMIRGTRGVETPLPKGQVRVTIRNLLRLDFGRTQVSLAVR